MLLAQAYLTRQQLSAVARYEPIPPQIKYPRLARIVPEVIAPHRGRGAA
jgi:hypothetical protein